MVRRRRFLETNDPADRNICKIFSTESETEIPFVKRKVQMGLI